MSIVSTVGLETCEVHVTASGGQGARALTCLLADVGQLNGLPALSMRSGTDPHRVRAAHQTETAMVQFASAGREPFRVTAVLQPDLMDTALRGIVLVNSPDVYADEKIRSIDATGIARSLGVPAYLPMVGAVAKTAGWNDLARITSAVRMALQAIAPYWVEPGVAAVEAGYNAVG